MKRVFLPLVLIFCLGIVAESVRAEETKPEATATPAVPQAPRVSRVQLKLVVDGEVVDVIEKGDLLTVVEERAENYVVRTFNGRKGVVAKVNAVAIAESADIYSELIKAAPDQGRLYTLRAAAYWEQGDKEKALSDFNRAIELGYTQPHAYVSRALFHAAVGDYEKALKDYQVAIDKEPTVVSHYVNRASVYMTLNEFAKAKADYDKAIELDPKNATLLQQRAIAMKALGELDASVAEFSKAIEMDDRSIPALMGRGFVFFQMGKHQEAVNDFGRVIELNPNAAVAYNNRGYNLQQIGQDKQALSDFDKSIELAPQYGLAHQNRAWIFVTAKDTSMRDPSAAVLSAEKACELSEFKNAGDVAALAAAYASKKDFEEAVGWQEKVVGLVSEDQKPFASAVLSLYQSNQPYDARVALEIVKQDKKPAKKK